MFERERDPFTHVDLSQPSGIWLIFYKRHGENYR